MDLEQIRGAVGTAAHRMLVQKVAERSLTLITNKGFFPTSSAKLGPAVHVSIQKNDVEPAAVAAAAKLKAALPIERTFVIRPDSDPAVSRESLSAAARARTVIVSLFNQRTVYVDNGPLAAKDQALVDALVDAKPDGVVVLSYGNPYVANHIPRAAAFVVGYGEGGYYGNQIIYADAFIRLLKGEIAATGKLPVRLP